MPNNAGLWISVAAVAGSLIILVYVFLWSLGISRQLKRDKARFAERLAKETARIETMEETARLSWTGYKKFAVVDRVDEVVEKNGGANVVRVASFFLRPFQRQGGQQGEFARLPPFNPGQYLQVRVDIPNRLELESRCYSLSQAYDPHQYRITVERVEGGVVSNHLMDSLKKGQGRDVLGVLDIAAPQGHFFLDPADEHPVVLMAWGLKVAPMICMFEMATKAKPEREVRMFLELPNVDSVMTQAGERSALKPLIKLAESRPNLSIAIHFTSGKKDEAHPDVPTTMRRLGRLAVPLIRREIDESLRTRAHFYVCGPGLQMRAAQHDLDLWGVPEDNVHFEYFDPDSFHLLNRVEEDTGECEVTFKGSGQVVAWDPEARHILGLAAEHKVRIPSTCKIGKCGECEVPLLSGKVRYSKEPEWQVSQGNCLACVAVPASSALVVGA